MWVHWGRSKSGAATVFPAKAGIQRLQAIEGKDTGFPPSRERRATAGLFGRSLMVSGERWAAESASLPVWRVRVRRVAKRGLNNSRLPREGGIQRLQATEGTDTGFPPSRERRTTAGLSGRSLMVCGKRRSRIRLLSGLTGQLARGVAKWCLNNSRLPREGGIQRLQAKTLGSRLRGNDERKPGCSESR